MKVWIVKGHAYATEELAKEACAYANYCEEMCGGYGLYEVTEAEIETEVKNRVPEEYRKIYFK